MLEDFYWNFIQNIWHEYFVAIIGTSFSAYAVFYCFTADSTEGNVFISLFLYLV